MAVFFIVNIPFTRYSFAKRRPMPAGDTAVEGARDVGAAAVEASVYDGSDHLRHHRHHHQLQHRSSQDEIGGDKIGVRHLALVAELEPRLLGAYPDVAKERISAALW